MNARNNALCEVCSEAHQKLVQASRVQFVFDDEALEVLVKSKESENKFVGGQNRWKFDSFTNWEFWWKDFPVLVYFKVRVLSSLSVCSA